jgi:hypothetical protein
VRLGAALALVLLFLVLAMTWLSVAAARKLVYTAD